MIRKVVPCRWVLLLSGWMAMCCLSQPVSLADEPSNPADAALRDSVWFDSDTEQIVPVHVTPRSDDSIHRNSRWLPRPKRVKQASTSSSANSTTNTTTTGGGGGGGTGLFGSGLTFGNVLGWMLLVALVVGGIALALYFLSKAEIDLAGDNKKSAASAAKLPDQQTIERMKHLPAELRRTDVNMRTEAQRLMGEGKYDQAIILLFGHQLLMLDQHGFLRLNRGKTNRKYLRETKAVSPVASELLNETVETFERSYFGRHEIIRDEFRKLWNENERLEQLVSQHQEQAA